LDICRLVEYCNTAHASGNQATFDIFQQKVLQLLRNAGATEKESEAALHHFIYWAREQAGQPRWRQWCDSVNLDIQMLTGFYSSASSSSENGAFEGFERTVHAIFRNNGTSDADGIILLETFCLWAAEKQRAQGGGPIYP
jgi:hypothetical protein